MLTCLFQIVILKETLVFLFLASHFDTIESWKVIVGYRDNCYAKKKKKSNVSNLEFLSKSEIYMILTFSRSLCTNMLIRNDFFVFTYTGKWKKFPYFHYFYWNPGKRFTFKCSPLMTSMIFHSRSLTLKKKPVTYLVIMFQLMYIFSHVEELKITFSTSLHFDTRIM